MDKAKLLTQLRRVEGQLRGIETMIETERGLVPTMQQLMAARAGLRKVMVSYVELFLRKDGEKVEITQEQLTYILSMIDK